jgi:hypothetical protein
MPFVRIVNVRYNPTYSRVSIIVWYLILILFIYFTFTFTFVLCCVGLGCGGGVMMLTQGKFNEL